MIVRMKRLTLLALNADRENIYDALIRTKSVQLKRSAEIDSFENAVESQAREKVLADISRVEDVIAYVTSVAEAHNFAHKHDKSAKVTIAKNSFARPRTEIDFDYYLGFGAHAEAIEQDLSTVAAERDNIAALTAEVAQKSVELNKLKPYIELPHPTTWYKDTATSSVRLCQLPESELTALNKLAEDYETVCVEQVCRDVNLAVVVIVAHVSESDFFEKASALGLVRCTIVTDVLPAVSAETLERQINGLNCEIKASQQNIAQFVSHIPEWKVYVDWLLLREKKLAADGDVRKTASAFVLEGYCPAEKEEQVTSAIKSVTEATVLTFDEIGEDEFAPTLLRNGKFVTPFESVTNSYSAPEYHEIDPNPVMSAFYFIIFGLMVADVGYGLLLLVAGIAATFLIKQKTGLKLMLQMFGICGVSAMAVGVLFGSVFGFTMWDKIFTDPSHPLHNGVIPNPADYPMVMMIISLLFGVVHLSAGVCCKMAVKIKHKQYLSAWLTDFPWIVVFAAFVTAIFNSALDMAAYEPYEVLRLPAIVSQIALYICLAALAVALVCAGLDTKGFLGKVVKSFGSAYGIINYFSDIMSYIRVFGLMLSSAIMASVVNQLGGMLAGNGGFGYVTAALLLVFAHMFNLVMGLLSVYIHNGRLQYVEFFGKFYTGDGQLFVPFGSDTKYSLVQ